MGMSFVKLKSSHHSFVNKLREKRKSGTIIEVAAIAMSLLMERSTDAYRFNLLQLFSEWTLSEIGHELYILQN